MIFSAFFVLFLFISQTCSLKIYSIDATKALGRVFEGIGGLSGGGATSKLLVNYPQPQRDLILDYLFKPDFGASLHILKVEVPGDAQSTDGTESSHMHHEWEEDYSRGYEWWIMKEAKKRNPNIKLCGLPWAFPAWVGKESHDPFKYPEITATYVAKWVKGAKEHHGLDIDCIGVWNERRYTKEYVIALKKKLKEYGFDKVKMVVGDGDWYVAEEMAKDKTFFDAVDIIGAHYPGTNSSKKAQGIKKSLWSSEDYSTFNNDVGAGCWARILNQNYVNGYMTSTISWNLIASYYDDLPFPRNGLMTANQPWSGYFSLDSPLWITAHTTQFTQIGWSYLEHGKGVGLLEGGGSYVTLMSPDKKDMTIVIETMQRDHSICVRPYLPPYEVKPQRATFKLYGDLAGIDTLYVWQTQLQYNGETSDVFMQQKPIKVTGGSFSIDIRPDQVFTITTLKKGVKPMHESPPSKPFPLPFVDNFESYPENSEAFNWAPQSGVWEVRKSSMNADNLVNKQVLLDRPIEWCYPSLQTINLGGDYSWHDIRVSVDVNSPSINGSSGMFVAALVANGGCEVANTAGLFFVIFPGTKDYAIYCDIVRKCVLHKGTVSEAFKQDTWYSLALFVKGSKFQAVLNGKQVHTSDNLPQSLHNGFVGYGTTDYRLAEYDNFVVNK